MSSPPAPLIFKVSMIDNHIKFLNVIRKTWNYVNKMPASIFILNQHKGQHDSLSSSDNKSPTGTSTVNLFNCTDFYNFTQIFWIRRKFDTCKTILNTTVTRLLKPTINVFNNYDLFRIERTEGLGSHILAMVDVISRSVFNRL